MAAAVYSFTVEQGATLEKQIVWKDTEGTPRDLTGWTARMQIRPAISSDTISHEFTTEDDGIELGGTAGTITIMAAASVTTNWTWTSGVYDLELIDPSGKVLRLLKGQVTVDPEVTR